MLIIEATIRQEGFAAQPSIERIDLRHNRLSTIEGAAFVGLHNPKEIYLSGNQIAHLNSDVFQVIGIATLRMNDLEVTMAILK